MKMIAMFIPALLVGSMALAQGAPAGDAAGSAAPAADSAAPKSAKEAKKACKDQSAGDKKAFKKCMSDWKKSQPKK